MLLSLPNELLVAIFEHLDDYEDLKLGVIPTCKLFRDILLPSPPSCYSRATSMMSTTTKTSTKTIDRILFRGYAPLHDDSTDDENQTIRIHPVFNELLYDCSPSIHNVLLKRTGRKLIDSSAANENAVSPAVVSVSVKIGYTFWAKIPSSSIYKDKKEDKKGEERMRSPTVLDVMNAVVERFKFLEESKGSSAVGDENSEEDLEMEDRWKGFVEGDIEVDEDDDEDSSDGGEEPGEMEVEVDDDEEEDEWAEWEMDPLRYLPKGSNEWGGIRKAEVNGEGGVDLYTSLVPVRK